MMKKDKKKKDVGEDYSNFALRLVLICTILILGSSIIFAFRNNFIEDDKKKEEMEVDQELIDLLYSYVAYGKEIKSMQYFYVNDTLTKDTFDNFEKVKYAFQLVNENNVNDLTETGFTIDKDTYQKLVNTIFGQDSEIENAKEFEVISTNVLKDSIVNVKYAETQNKYIVTKIKDFDRPMISPVYTKVIDSAVDSTNNTIIIKEKVIFTSVDYDKEGHVSNIKVYKDSFHQKLIKEVTTHVNYPMEEFNFENYLEDAITVTYTFKLSDDGNYYFESSKIEE